MKGKGRLVGDALLEGHGDFYKTGVLRVSFHIKRKWHERQKKTDN